MPGGGRAAGRLQSAAFPLGGVRLLLTSAGCRRLGAGTWRRRRRREGFSRVRGGGTEGKREGGRRPCRRGGAREMAAVRGRSPLLKAVSLRRDAAAAGALGPPGCVANCVRPVLPQPSAGSDSVGETAVPQDRARRGLLRAAQQVWARRCRPSNPAQSISRHGAPTALWAAMPGHHSPVGRERPPNI